ncbi:hypothetical protein AFCA_011231 [Aspergillus flavus]|uniref:SH3 domain-containing protein n=1 Tax=Aspergillus flavus TaxID=5059 RepID=A0AB74C9M1_ASPFL|nr:hypothetical protein CA14_011294 [Aspergillus flavus]UDD63978.1 hypothetical protein AFCA_011231 [Aspergillus flavus]
MQSNDGSLLPEQPSGIETVGGSAGQFSQWTPGLTERQSNTGLNSQNQGSSWDGGAQSSTPDDGLYHPGRKTAGTQETKKSATDNGLASSGSQGANGWSQDSGQPQAGSAAWGTAGTASGGQWVQGTTSGSTGSNAGQASIEAKSPQTSMTRSGLQATPTPSQAPTPYESSQYEGQNTWGNGNGGQWSSSSSLPQAGAGTPDDGMYHPEYSNTNGQGAQQWTPDDGLYHPDEWSPSSTTKPTSTSSLPENTATQSSPPLSSSSTTSTPTATSNPSNSTTTSTNEAKKLAIPITLGVATAAMAGIILWWLYRKVQDAKAERKRMNTLEEGGYIQGPRLSFFKRRLATLCSYSLSKSATKSTPVAARSSLSISESPCKQCDGHSDASETSSLDETSSRDIEKLQPPEYSSSTESLTPEGHRRGDISMPYNTQKADTCARPRTVTPTSLPGVPEEPEESEEAKEAEEPSPQITPVDSKGAVEEVYTVEISFNPISAKHVELKQGQTARILKEYGDGWALCYLPKSKAEGLAPRAYLSATPVKRQVSSSSNPMQHPQYNVSQFSFSSQSTNLGLDWAQPSSR